MAARARLNRGFSLVEMMIAIAIIMISMLAVLTAILKSAQTNLENDVRNTAIRITNQTAEVLYALPATLTYTDPELTDGTHTRAAGNTTQNEKGFPFLTQTVRQSQQAYTIDWSVVSQTNTVKEVTISVRYTLKKNNQNFTNTAVIYKHAAI